MSSQIQVYFYYVSQASSLTNELAEVKRSQNVTTLNQFYDVFKALSLKNQTCKMKESL